MARLKKPKPSVDELESKLETLSEQVLILSIAHCDRPDITHTHRQNGDTYRWSAYRIAGAAGGYVVCKFSSPHSTHASTLFVGRLDVLSDLPPTMSNDDGHREAAAIFRQERWNRHHKSER